MRHLAYNFYMRRMATKGPPLTYTQTCTHCQAVVPFRDVINNDAEHNRCPKCSEAYKVPGSEKWQPAAAPAGFSASCR